MESELKETCKEQEHDPNRRKFLKTAATTGAAAFTTNLFTGNVKGANSRIALGFIGVGQQGRNNLRVAMNRADVETAAVCDVYQPCLDYAARLTNARAKPVKDFRDMLANKSIDAVCIATPDHWHAYMTVEAC